MKSKLFPIILIITFLLILTGCGDEPTTTEDKISQLEQDNLVGQAAGSRCQSDSNCGRGETCFYGTCQVECASGCPEDWIGDNICDKSCQTRECRYDAGDCGNRYTYLFVVEKKEDQYAIAHAEVFPLEINIEPTTDRETLNLKLNLGDEVLDAKHIFKTRFGDDLDYTSFVITSSKDPKEFSSIDVSLFNGRNKLPLEFREKGSTYSVIFSDNDQDGFYDIQDNCPDDYNPQQKDIDFDGIGDLCDNKLEIKDSDGDSIIDKVDNCPDKSNSNQADEDNDGIGNKCDKDYKPTVVPDTSTRFELFKYEKSYNPKNVLSYGIKVNVPSCTFDKISPFDIYWIMGEKDGSTEGMTSSEKEQFSPTVIKSDQSEIDFTFKALNPLGINPKEMKVEAFPNSGGCLLNSLVTLNDGSEVKVNKFYGKKFGNSRVPG